MRKLSLVSFVLAMVLFAPMSHSTELGPFLGTTQIVDESGSPIVESNGGLPVNNQDQTTPMLFVKASVVSDTTTLTAQVNLDDKVISVASTTGISVGSYLGLFNLDTDRYYAGYVISIDTLDLTMDSLIDSTFEIGSIVGVGITNMAVDGSVTPQVFTLRGADPGIGVTVDVTRFIITCEAPAAVNLANFCGIAALTNGIQIRHRNGATFNILNWKTNGDVAGSMYDWIPFAATNPSQGVDGFVARLTIAGQNKVGVVIRLGPGEEIQFIVQDNLLAIPLLEIMNEGHVVFD